jgi:hypothetical protein
MVGRAAVRLNDGLYALCIRPGFPAKPGPNALVLVEAARPLPGIDWRHASVRSEGGRKHEGRVLMGCCGTSLCRSYTALAARLWLIRQHARAWASRFAEPLGSPKSLLLQATSTHAGIAAIIYSGNVHPRHRGFSRQRTPRGVVQDSEEGARLHDRLANGSAHFAM